MQFSTWLTFLAATIVVMIAPGPSVTLIVANSLRTAAAPASANVAGFQAGFAIMVVLTLAGLASLIAAMGEWFVWVRLLGAAYLVFLGVRLILGREDAHGVVPQHAARRLFCPGDDGRGQQSQGAALLRRLLPAVHGPGRQCDPADPHHGADAMAVAAITDTTFVLLAARVATGSAQAAPASSAGAAAACSSPAACGWRSGGSDKS